MLEAVGSILHNPEADAELAERLALAVYRLTRVFPEDEPLRKKLREAAVAIALKTARAPDVNDDHPVKASSNGESVFQVIDDILILFGIARPQGLVKEENFLVLKAHYEKLKTRLFQESADIAQQCQPKSGPEARDDADISKKCQPKSGPEARDDRVSRPSASADKQNLSATNLLPKSAAAREGYPNDRSALKNAGERSTTLNARQKKIIQQFRTRESFQLREVRALFEGYSQKTIRNDLKVLCQEGILNREGVGVVSFYRVADD